MDTATLTCTTTLCEVTGMRVIESEHAMTLPDTKPHTDDMRAMVEHFHRLGLVERKPAAFKTPQGLIVHPTIMRTLRQRVSQQMDDMAQRAMFGFL